MENEGKKRDLTPTGTGKDLVGPLDSTSRARNRTVMLTPEMTGHMRSKMLDAGELRTSSSDSDWGDSPKEAFGGRLIGHDVREDDDGNDWTRAIEPATFGDDDQSGEGGDADNRSEMSWAPSERGDGSSEESSNGYHFDTDPDSDVTSDENEPFVAEPRHEHPTPLQVKNVKKVSEVSKQTLVECDTDYESITWKQLTPVAGFLVSYDNDPNGVVVVLRTGRLIVTSEFDGSGNIFHIKHDSVSPMHAIMRVSAGGNVQLLDQLSETGTRIVRGADGQEELLSGEKANLYHGDTVFFGDRKYNVCLVHIGSSGK